MIETKEQYEEMMESALKFPSFRLVHPDWVQLSETIEALRDVARAISRMDIQGAESWARVIIEEWELGDQDYASMKVAEKVLKVAPELQQALVALPDWITE